MRITVTQHLFMKQRTLALEDLDDLVIGCKHMLAGKDLGIGQKTAITVDRVIHGQVIAAADHVVVLAMSGCGMHGTGTRF
jgi:L-arabinose isomerase